MKITGMLRDGCPNGETCPRIHDTDGDEVIVQGTVLRDTAARRRIPLDTDEELIVVPRSLVEPDLMDLPAMAAYLREHHGADLLRIENQRAYSVPSDGGDFPRYLAGEDAPLEGDAWRQRLRDEHAAGKYRRKIHIVAPGGLSDYERYEFEWGFAGTVAAGEDVRILDCSVSAWAEVRDVADFWVTGDRNVVVMRYDEIGRFRGAYVVTDVSHAAAYRALAQDLWDRSTPFTQWWAENPNEHRRARAA